MAYLQQTFAYFCKAKHRHGVFWASHAHEAQRNAALAWGVKTQLVRVARAKEEV